MKKKLLLICILLVQLFAVYQSSTCGNFLGVLHFSSFDLQLRLIESIHNDVDSPLFIVRLFHNKLVGSIIDIFGNYLQFWNVLFLTNFISLAGVVGIAVQFYYFFIRKKTKWLWTMFFFVLLTPFIEIMDVALPFVLRLVILILPLLLWSLLGYWHLLKDKKIP